MDKKIATAIENYAKKQSFWKLAKKEVWAKGKAPNLLVVDLSTDVPWVGISTGTARIESEDSGITETLDIKQNVMRIYDELSAEAQQPPASAEPPITDDESVITKAVLELAELSKIQDIDGKNAIATVMKLTKDKAQAKRCVAEVEKRLEQHKESPPEPKLPFTCYGCGTGITAEQRDTSYQTQGKAYCPACVEKSNAPPPAKASEAKMPETPGAGSRPAGATSNLPAPELALKPAKINDAEPSKKPISDKELSSKLEAEEQKKELAKTQFKAGSCEAVAKQYGIPAELANMFFMVLNDGLYIKNPGLLHLAAKKGYSRIEVTSKYNDKTQEWESESKIYPKVTSEMVSSICQLTPELQKIAWEYMTAPTNGTGAASTKSVKMSTMHPFLKEMSQTRAQNRALRAYTGYGGTSLEELPEAELKY